MNRSKEVDKYLAEAPTDAKAKLKQVRVAIRGAAPEAVEGISYGMPYYSFKGESGVESRLCYFGVVKSTRELVFYTRPRFLEGFQDEVKRYLTTKSALHFAWDRPIPVRLIEKLVRNAVRKHTASH